MIPNRTRAVAIGALIVSFIAGNLLLVHVLVSKTSPGPRTHLPAGRVYDFGEIEEGEHIRHVFPIENIGSEALRILNVATRCGCTGAQMNMQEIPPGAKAEIEVTYSGRRVRAREALIAVVQTNDAENPFLEFMLTGYVRYKVFWYPTSVGFFGEHGHDFEPKQIVFMAPRRPEKPLQLEVASISSSMISAEMLADERGFVLQVGVSPECPPGAYGESVVIKHANEDSTRPITIPVHIKIL